MAASDQRQRAKAAWRESSAKGFRGPGGRRPGRSAAFLSGALLSLCLVALVGYLLAERPTLQSDSLSQWKLAALRALDVAPGLPRVGYHRSAEIKYLNRTLLLGFLLGLFWFHRRPVALACLFGIGAWVHGALVDLWPEFALQFHLHELSVVETATALGFGLASVLLFLHLLADRRARTGWTLGLLGLFFVCFGEETSWLQHYVRF